MNRAQMEALSAQRQEQRAGSWQAEMTSPNQFLLNGHRYVVQVNYRAAFDPAAFADRFSPILSKYDYLVGDWGYGQLRLRGFYRPQNPQFKPERGLATVRDYLYEECNFGCPYFVVQNLEVQVPRRVRRDAAEGQRRHKKGTRSQHPVGRSHRGRHRRRRKPTHQEAGHA